MFTLAKPQGHSTLVFVVITEKIERNVKPPVSDFFKVILFWSVLYASQSYLLWDIAKY